MNIAQAIPTTIVTLREGVEAALVVGIVLACVHKAEQQALNRWVFGGVIAGLTGSVLIGAFLGLGLQQLQYAMPDTQSLFKPVLSILFGGIAIIMLSWMLLWMTRQARSLKTDIDQTVSTALANETDESVGLSIFSLVCIAVLREGFEAVLFIFTQSQTLADSLLGVIMGVLGAVLIGLGLFKWGIRINLSVFFQVMGVLLLLIISGLVVSVCHNIDITCDALSQLTSLDLCLGFKQSCVLGPRIWDASHILPDKQWPGLVLKVLLGYRDRIYLMQLLAYIVFWLVIGRRYFQTLNQSTNNQNEQTVSPST